jgi:protease-4
MSDSSRLQTNVLLTNIWNLILSDISKDRKIPISKLNYYAENATIRNLTLAKKFNFIKEVKFKDEIIELLKKKINCKEINQ